MEGFLLTVFIEDCDGRKLATDRWFFTEESKCETFIFKLFGRRMFEWARKHSDEWEKIQEKLGFKRRTDDKCLEILSNDPNTMRILWDHYSSQGMAQGDDGWGWDIKKVPLNAVEIPVMIGAYNLDKDF